MANIKLSGRYAKSLIDLAKEKNSLETVMADATLYNDAATNKEFANVMKSPIINAEKKIAIINQLFSGKMSDLTLSFIRLVINKSREYYLNEIMQQVVAQYNALRGVTDVIFTSAAQVDSITLDKVKLMIQQNSQLKNINLISKVDDKLVGGFVLEYGDKLFDASIANDLKAIKKQFLDNLFVKKF